LDEEYEIPASEFRRNLMQFRQNLRRAFGIRRPLRGVREWSLSRRLPSSQPVLEYDETRVVTDKSTGRKYKVFLNDGRIVYSEEVMPQPHEIEREKAEAEASTPIRQIGQIDIVERLREWRESRPSILRSIAKVFEESAKQVELESKRKELEIQRVEKLLQEQEKEEKKKREEESRSRYQAGHY